ncbi:MAG: hypothetical protein AB8B81_13995 [Halioglobus sp.]
MKTVYESDKRLRVFFASIFLFVVTALSLPVLADHHSASDYPALGVAEFPGLCKYRGHIGKYQCLEVKAKKHRLYSCKGKNLHYSKVKGVKACYSCPRGYSRYSPTRKMDHKKACTLRQPGKNKYSKAKKIGTLVSKCGKGQFKYKGSCHSCPKKTKRKHVAGLDSGYCKVEKPYRCNKGLTLHKSNPVSVLDRLGNVAGLKHRKYCGIPFNLKQYGKDIIDSEENKAVIVALRDLGKAMSKKNKSTKKKMKRFKKAVKDSRLQDAYDIVVGFDEYDDLKSLLSKPGGSASTVGNAGRQFSISLGHVVDVSLGIGASWEWGIALDFSEMKIKRYRSYTNSKGLSAGGDGGVTIGIWKGAFKSGAAQGYVGAVSAGVAGGGAGIWSDYYTPKRSDGSNQPHFVGISITGGVGAGFEIGEYGEVYTEVYKEESLIEN